MPTTLEPFTSLDIPSAIAVHSSSLANNPIEYGPTSLLSPEQVKESQTHEWTLALSNPFARIVKASSDGTLIGAAGFLTHEVGGLQWTSAERQTSAESVDKEIDGRLAEARDEVLKGDYNVWRMCSFCDFATTG